MRTYLIKNYVQFIQQYGAEGMMLSPMVGEEGKGRRVKMASENNIVFV